MSTQPTLVSGAATADDDKMLSVETSESTTPDGSSVIGTVKTEILKADGTLVKRSETYVRCDNCGEKIYGSTKGRCKPCKAKKLALNVGLIAVAVGAAAWVVYHVWPYLVAVALIWVAIRVTAGPHQGGRNSAQR